MRLHPTQKTSRLRRGSLLAFVGGAALIAGCGGSSHKSNNGVITQQRSGLTVGQARAVPIGTPQTQFFARFGPPASGPTPIRRTRVGDECFLYYAIGFRPDQLRWQICFRKGALSLVATNEPSKPKPKA